MIKGITGGAGLIVNGGSVSFPYVSQNYNNPIQGMLRLIGNDIQTFDGSSWITVAASYANVSLDSESLDLLQWAREEKNRQIQRESLVNTNPALQKALAAIERAEANFDILAKFVEHDYVDVVQSN